MCDAGNITIPKELNTDGVSFFPQLIGEKGTPRDWIYSWYSMSESSSKLVEFARNEEYKYYKIGDFYNVKKDFYQKEPISLSQLTPEEKKIQDMLKKVIQSYAIAPVEVKRVLTKEDLAQRKLLKSTIVKGEKKKNRVFDKCFIKSPHFFHSLFYLFYFILISSTLSS